MHIHTIEENYDYRMKKIMESFVEDYDDLKGLNPEELYDKMWEDYAKEFGRAVLEDMNDFAGDELFDVE